MNISVIITSYNQKQYLQSAIDSVLNQSLQPTQIIIVDDASSDGSQELIAGYAGRYPGLILPIYHTQNLGVSTARNSGLRNVTGAYVTYLDGDDRFLPEKLTAEAQALEKNPWAQIAFSNVEIIDPRGEVIGIWATPQLARQMPQGDVFCQVFMRKFPRRRDFRNELVAFQSWQSIGFYDPALLIYEDYDMRIRLTHQCQACFTGETHIQYRRQSTSLSRSRVELYLSSFDYLVQKNIHLLKTRTLGEQRIVERAVRAWRAELIRRRGRQALRAAPGNRLTALSDYWQATRLQPAIDLRFWMDFFLPPPWQESIKSRLRQFELWLARRNHTHLTKP